MAVDDTDLASPQRFNALGNGGFKLLGALDRADADAAIAVAKTGNIDFRSAIRCPIQRLPTGRLRRRATVS